MYDVIYTIRLQITPTQIITQQVAASSGQPVATLVKTTGAPSTVPSMSLPANTVNINVSLPQHKGTLHFCPRVHAFWFGSSGFRSPDQIRSQTARMS